MVEILIQESRLASVLGLRLTSGRHITFRYSNNNSEISAIDSPVIAGSSLSTVDWIISRFLRCKLNIFSSTVPRAINL